MTSTIASHSLLREGTQSVLRALTSRGSAWPEPKLSVGREIGYLGGGSELCWEAIGPAREAFRKLCPQIKQYLEIGVEPMSSWVTWSMYMVGKTAEVSNPTILFCCEVTAHRKSVRNVIKESGILDKYPGIKTGHAKRPPDFNQLVRVADIQTTHVPDLRLEALFRPMSNACGMELYINAGHINESPGRVVTVGGVIQLDEKFFYFTAEHAFGTESDDTNEPLSDSETDDDFSIDGDSASETTDDVLEGGNLPIGKLDISDNRGKMNDVLPSAATPSVNTAARHIQDTTGSEPLYENLEALEIPPRLISSADPPSNLDYALIEVSRLQHCVPNRITYKGRTLEIRNVARGAPKDVRILAITFRGVVSGRLSGTSMYTSPPSVNTYQEVYCGILDSNLRLGDCGTWVIDAETGNLIGHIVAGSPETGAAMIIPTSQTFDDIRARTAVYPTLPTRSLIATNPALQDEQYRRIRKTNSEPITRKLSKSDILWTQTMAEEFANMIRKQRRENLRILQRQIKATAEPDSHRDSTREASATAPEGSKPPGYGDVTKEDKFRALLRRKLPLVPEAPADGDRLTLKFRSLLHSLSEVPLRFESETHLALAQECIPFDIIYSDADALAQAYEDARDTGETPQWVFMDCIVMALLNWFKHTFFSWVNNPPCGKCRAPTVSMGMNAPTSEEVAYGALRVELYKCSNRSCEAYERFPRYSDPAKLLLTRRGRAGESVMCCGLLLRALGARVRWVWVATDHVFLEVYSDHQQRWVHVDPCENAFDKRRLYCEGNYSSTPLSGNDSADICFVGWGKSMVYVIAFSVDGATDITRRYVTRMSSFRENPRKRCSEEVLAYILKEIKTLRRREFSAEYTARLEKEDRREERELNAFVISSLTTEFFSDRASHEARLQDTKRLVEEERTLVERARPRQI